MTDPVQIHRRLRQALQHDDYQTAVVCLQEAVEQAREAGDLAAAGRHLGNLALLHNRMGQPETALTCFEQALACVRVADDRMTEDGLLGNMGNILRELGRYDEAREHLLAALRIAQEIGDVRGRGIWLSNLGLVYDDLGQREQAIEYHSQAIGVARQLQDQRGLAARLRKLSDSFLAAGNPVEALKCLGEALTIYTDIGDQGELLAGLRVGAVIHEQLGRAAASAPEAQIYFHNSYEYARHALALARALTDRPAEAALYLHLGTILGLLGDYAAGQQYAQAAAALFGALNLLDQQYIAQQQGSALAALAAEAG
jgi:tetratricopeptide (TPR) repeat protein